MDNSTTSTSVRSQLIEFNSVLSKFETNDLSPEAVRMFREVSTFCSSNRISSYTLEQMLETDPVLKIACQNLCRLFIDYAFYFEMRSARICAADKTQTLKEYSDDRRRHGKLIECEMDMLKELGVHLAKSSISNDETSLWVNKIAFIGSGPMPASSLNILIDYAPFADIYNIDMSQEANDLALIVAEQILPSHLLERMHFITQNITEKPLPKQVKSILNQCQLVYLAALVGDNELTKLNILENIVNQSYDDSDKKTTQYFVIRAAEGLCQVLYPKISIQKIATLEANTNDVNQDSDRKFLFEINAVRSSLDNSITHIIAKSA